MDMKYFAKRCNSCFAYSQGKMSKCQFGNPTEIKQGYCFPMQDCDRPKTIVQYKQMLKPKRTKPDKQKEGLGI